MTKEYRLEVKIKNNFILKKIESLGYTSIPKFCKDKGMSYQLLLKTIALKEPPLDSSGLWRKHILKFCEIIGCEPEDLFTAEQRKMRLTQNIRRIEIEEERIKDFNRNYFLETPNDPYSLQIESEKSDLLDLALERLKPRERRVLEGRYLENKTLDEIGAEEGVQRERIRQIEAKALRKMRGQHIGVGNEAFRDLMEG